MKKKIRKYLRKRRWLALLKMTKARFTNLGDSQGDNFPVFAIR